VTHRRRDPYTLSRAAAVEQARAQPRNRRLHEARSLADYAPHALAYPLLPENLVLVVAFGLGQALLDALFPHLWLARLLPCALVVFLLEVVAHTARGYGEPPRFTTAHLVAAFGRALPAMGLVGLAVVSLIVLVDRELHGATLVAFAFWSLALPAQLALLAITDDAFTAFDLRRAWHCLTAGGFAYAMLVVVTATVLAEPADIDLAWGALTDHLPASGSVVADLLQVYALFAVAHLLGAAFHLRRDALGLQAVVAARSEAEADAESLQESVARLLKLADEEEHHERHEAAAQLLLTAPFGSYPARPWLEELFEGACRRPKPYFAEAAGQRLVAHLVATQQWARALEVVVHAAQRWPRFQPANLDERVELARRAFELRATLAFRQLTERLEALGAAPQAVDLGFLVARWRAERDDDAAGALAALAPLLARTEHPAHRRIAALDAALRGGRG
jgi:hypothetical protein